MYCTLLHSPEAFLFANICLVYTGATNHAGCRGSHQHAGCRHPHVHTSRQEYLPNKVTNFSSLATTMGPQACSDHSRHRQHLDKTECHSGNSHPTSARLCAGPRIRKKQSITVQPTPRAHSYIHGQLYKVHTAIWRSCAAAGQDVCTYSATVLLTYWQQSAS